MLIRRPVIATALGTLSCLSLQLGSAIVPTHSVLHGAAQTLGWTQAAIALPKYRSPKDRPVVRTTTAGGGSRGCNKVMPVSFTLLVPTDHVGLTALGRPTFAWYASAASSVPMQFALVEPGVSQPIVTQQVAVQTAGLNQMTLPANAPDLVPGKKYRWTISQVCNPQRPSENAYARGWIERVTVSSEQATAIASAKTYTERGELLAAQGRWYDALAAYAKGRLENPRDRVNTESFLALLDQAGLKQVAEQERRHFMP